MSKLEGIELLQAFLEAGGEDVEKLEVEINGKTVTFQYKPLGWMGKSRCVSAATEYVPHQDAKGTMSVKVTFHMDVYKKAALREMLVDPPIPMTDAVLEKIPEPVGVQLDAIIPDPFGVVQETTAVKKGSATSPEAAD